LARTRGGRKARRITTKVGEKKSKRGENRKRAETREKRKDVMTCVTRWNQKGLKGRLGTKKKEESRESKKKKGFQWAKKKTDHLGEIRRGEERID